MRSLATYFAERFPPLRVIPVSIASAILLIGFTTTTSLNWGVVGAVALAFLAFLLRQRVTDEFKDANHDDSNYPDRPVQRGVISRPVLVSLGAIALLVEIGGVVSASVLSGSLPSVVWYLPFLGWSALTSVEFFAHDWLNRHFTLYFVSHQVIFVWLAVWAVALSNGHASLATITGAIAFVLLMAAVEIVRKFEIRRAPDGSVVPDTYTAVWGLDTTVAVLSGLLGCVGALGWWQSGQMWTALVAAVAVALVALGNRTDRTVQAALALVLVGNSVIVTVR